MTDGITFTRYDAKGQRTSTRLHTVDVTAINFDNVKTGIANMASDLLAIVSSQVAVETQSLQVKSPNAARGGRREAKWLLRLQDDVDATIYTYELGPADLTAPTIISGGREYLDPANALFINLAAEFQAGTIVSKSGNLMTLRDVELVGRNI